MQLDDAIFKIREAHRKRRFAINVQGKLDNSLLGFTLHNHFDVKWETMSDADRKKLTLRAQKLISDAKSKEPSEEAGAISDFVMTTKLAKEPANEMRREAEKKMADLAIFLPIHDWWVSMEGRGALGLATIIAETGDLSNYPGVYPLGHPLEGQMRPKSSGVDCLAKRLGFAPYDGFAGSTWKRETWRPRSLTKEEWIANPFSSRRYSFIHQVGYNLIKMRQLISKTKTEDGRSAPNGIYGAHYCNRRERTDITHPEWTDGHRDADALRYAIKKLLRDMWGEWRKAVDVLPAMAMAQMPSVTEFADEARQGAMVAMPKGHSFAAPAELLSA